MKFLFDFDGVLTNQTEEALRVREILESYLAELAGANRASVSELMLSAEKAMEEDPAHHGWRSQSRVTAFYNEDLFIHVYGIASCLDQWSDEGHSWLRDAAATLRQQSLENFAELAQLAYRQMAQETHSGKLKPIDPLTAPLMQKLLDRGHQTVVVSNSSTDRILALLQGVGLPAVDHSADPAAALRVRGDARKFELGAHSRTIGFVHGGNDYRVEVNRPVYEAILREEKVQVVVGDVFSLDLALPFHLARNEPETFGGLNAFLRVQHYTPSWSRALVSSLRDESARLNELEDIGDLIRFIDTLG